MNLLQKLNEETKKRLDTLNEDNTPMYEELMSSLKKEEYLGDLRYYHVNILCGLYQKTAEEIRSYNINPYQMLK